MDFLSLLLQLAFFSLFGVALWRYIRHRRTLELTIVAVFATTAATFVISLATELFPDAAAALRPLSTTILLAQPFLIVRLVDMISPLPRWATPSRSPGSRWQVWCSLSCLSARCPSSWWSSDTSSWSRRRPRQR